MKCINVVNSLITGQVTEAFKQGSNIIKYARQSRVDWKMD